MAAALTGPLRATGSSGRRPSGAARDRPLRFGTPPPGRRTDVAARRRRGMGGHMLLEGRRLLVTGVLTESSIAFSIARRAQEEGAELVLTGFGRGVRVTPGAGR